MPLLLLNPTRMSTRDRLKSAGRAVLGSSGIFCRDVGHGLLVVGHNAMATVGMVAVAALALGLGDAQLRNQIEASTLQWLQDRHDVRTLASGDTLQGLAEPNAVNRATAADIKDLPRQQARLAQWISRRYRVAPEPVSALVREAWDVGQRARLDPTLILSIMAVESRFNPFAHSAAGAQGLMQVMTQVHDDKYDPFGGIRAAFDPITNLRVGVQVLKESIARGGSVEEGLRHYVGAALLDDDAGYAGKVLAEQAHMRNVMEGRAVPANIFSGPPAIRSNPANVPATLQQTTAPTGTPDAKPEAPKAVEASEQVALVR